MRSSCQRWIHCQFSGFNFRIQHWISGPCRAHRYMSRTSAHCSPPSDWFFQPPPTANVLCRWIVPRHCWALFLRASAYKDSILTGWTFGRLGCRRRSANWASEHWFWTSYVCVLLRVFGRKRTDRQKTCAQSCTHAIVESEGRTHEGQRDTFEFFSLSKISNGARFTIVERRVHTQARVWVWTRRQVAQVFGRPMAYLHTRVQLYGRTRVPYLVRPYQVRPYLDYG